MSNSVQRIAVVENLLVSVTSAGVPSDQDWQEFLKALRTEPITAYIAGTLGKTEASSVQRKQAADILKTRSIRTCVLTDDTMVRGLVTAMSWLGANMNAFSWTDIKGALKYLNVTGTATIRVEEVLLRLRAEVEVKKK